jgi:hypothetical protein
VNIQPQSVTGYNCEGTAKPRILPSFGCTVLFGIGHGVYDFGQVNKGESAILNRRSLFTRLALYLFYNY